MLYPISAIEKFQTTRNFRLSDLPLQHFTAKFTPRNGQQNLLLFVLKQFSKKMLSSLFLFHVVICPHNQGSYVILVVVDPGETADTIYHRNFIKPPLRENKHPYTDRIWNNSASSSLPSFLPSLLSLDPSLGLLLTFFLTIIII